MKHTLFYEMNQKENNMILFEVFDEETLFEGDDLMVLDLMLIYEIFLNHFFDEELELEQKEKNLQVFLEKTLKQFLVLT
jgi:hypothetical protein